MDSFSWKKWPWCRCNYKRQGNTTNVSSKDKSCKECRIATEGWGKSKSEKFIRLRSYWIYGYNISSEYVAISNKRNDHESKTRIQAKIACRNQRQSHRDDWWPLKGKMNQTSV